MVHSGYQTPKTNSDSHEATEDSRESTEDLATLRLLTEQLPSVLPGVIDEFYARLLQDSATAKILGYLSSQRVDELKRHQVAHLLLVLDPDSDPSARQQASMSAGSLHGMIGIELEAYTAALIDHQHHLVARLSSVFPENVLDRVRAVLGARFMADLQYACVGYRNLESSRAAALSQIIADASTSRTVPDLARRVLSELGRLDGMLVCLFARCDAAGNMVVEFGDGPGLAGYLQLADSGRFPPVTVAADDAHAQGPVGRAWRSGSMEHSEAMEHDGTVTAWLEVITALGWAAECAIPLVDRSGVTRALILLVAKWHGYFSPLIRLRILDQVKVSVESALVDLEDHPGLGTAVSAFKSRRTSLRKLAHEGVEMWFQPIVDLTDGRVLRMEALARLRVDDRLALPAEILPAFGDRELFHLFDVGLEQSSQAMQAWGAEGVRTDISLNLPTQALIDRRYHDAIDALIGRHGMDPGRLTLEILETGALDFDLNRRQALAEDLAEQGVRLSQDDLGSGYSSLLRLRSFPFDEVKIDRILVRGDNSGYGSGLHFIGPICSIADRLGIAVVIEGLENDGLIEAAIQLNVRAGQGYGISPPLPAHAVPGWIRTFRMDFDRNRPRTPIGALAGHLAWQHGVTVGLPWLSGEWALRTRACPMSSYLEGRDDRVVAAHEAAHRSVLSRKDGAEQRSRWNQLAELATEISA